ncbi:MAG: thymidylate kinase [Oscillospiraceae bacterium]|nr:thymidylate kinase [Oscillospiraceae bacterium]
MAGKIIVIEGLDGSGKATQTELLYKRLKDDGMNVKKLTFPCYDSDSSALVRMYLGGELGNNPNAVNPYTASAFYAVDRAASFIKDWKEDYDSGTVFLCDRYSTSNPIYQLCKLAEDEYDEFLQWIQDFEHNKLEIPAPDYVIYLDMPTEVSQKLLSKRYKGNEEKKDIHEKNLDFLNKCRKSAEICAEKMGWKVISCAKKGEPRAIEEIAQDVYSHISKSIGE